MVLCKSTRADDVAPVCGLAFVDVHDGYNASSTSLNNDAASLVELESEDVFVVGESDDELNDKFTATRDDCPAGPPVRVLPVDAVVLFMNTDNVWCFLTLAIGTYDHAVEVLDDAQAVTAELQIVRAVAEATVAEVEGLLAMEGCSWICVWDGLVLLASIRAGVNLCRLLTISLNAIR